MTKQSVCEFEASRDLNGQYICHSYREVDPNIIDPPKNESSTKQSASFQSAFTGQKNNFSETDDVFAQSYQSNFTQGNNNYINNMRQQFSQMRQSMLDQMESFTYVQNIKK